MVVASEIYNPLGGFIEFATVPVTRSILRPVNILEVPADSSHIRFQREPPINRAQRLEIKCNFANISLQPVLHREIYFKKITEILFYLIRWNSSNQTSPKYTVRERTPGSAFVSFAI